MEIPVAEAAKRLFSTTWFMALGGFIVMVYLAALLWKLLRAEEGFLFGYGDWIVGKWRSDSDDDENEHDTGRDRNRRSPGNGRQKQENQPPERQRRRDLASLDREIQEKNNVLKLSRLLDGDLAYLMVNDEEYWERNIMRALQMIVSGITRVVRPVGRCRCGFFILADDEQHLVMVVGEGYSGAERPCLALERSCAGRAFVTGDNYYCRDIATDPVYWHSTRGRSDFRSIACTPVRAGNSVFGVICLDAEHAGAFTQEDFAHLEVFSAKMAVFCAFHTLQSTGLCAARSEGECER